MLCGRLEEVNTSNSPTTTLKLVKAELTFSSYETFPSPILGVRLPYYPYIVSTRRHPPKSVCTTCTRSDDNDESKYRNKNYSVANASGGVSIPESQVCRPILLLVKAGRRRGGSPLKCLGQNDSNFTFSKRMQFLWHCADLPSSHLSDAKRIMRRQYHFYGRFFWVVAVILKSLLALDGVGEFGIRLGVGVSLDQASDGLS